MIHPIDDFRDAMTAAGLRCHDPIIADGKLHRFTIDGDKPRSLNGWYVFHDDGVPAGAFGSWKHDIASTWCGKADNELTPAERTAYKQRIEAMRREREAEQERVRQAAREKAAAIWEDLQPANDNHPYLQRKQVKAFGIRESRGSLVLPVRSPDGMLQSLQFIDPDGGKLFLKGGMKAGCYFKIGGAPVDRVIVAEGYATGASLHMAHGCPVAIAFDAGNLEPVSKAIRERLPEHVAIEIWADNDLNTKGNPGVTKANKAAEAIGAKVVVPEIAGDWNDVAVADGINAVRDVVVANDNQPTDLSPLPDIGARGKPLATILNLQVILERLGVYVRYNVVRKEEEITIPGASFSIDNMANASLAWIMSECARFNYPTDKVGDFLTFLADRNLYNPAIQFVTSKPWDGQPRLQAFFNTITAKGQNQSLKETLIKRWMLSAIAAAFRPDGVSAHGVLVLQGDQYLGKTKWFKSLVPDSTRLAQDGMMLRPDDKDSVKQACSFWLVELGELDATFRKSDIAALKAFLTRDRDVLRRAYARKESEYARRTVFFASVNPREFLHDPTGNRRYWTIECEHIDHSHGLDMQQVWAEVYSLYQAGEGWFLLPEEMDALNHHNSDFEVRDPIEDRIHTQLDWAASLVEWRWKSATDVLLSIGLDHPSKADVTHGGFILRKLNGGKAKRTGATRQLFVPPHVNERTDRPF
jgi:putative DNA primase/helicase